MKPEETIALDPVGMNIVNRIAAGTKFTGVIECAGGLLVQGQFDGKATVTGGPLVLMPEGELRGEFTCDQDAYLFGKILAPADAEQSELVAGGAVFLAETLKAKANITSRSIRSFEGADVDGRIRTGKKAVGASPE